MTIMAPDARNCQAYECQRSPTQVRLIRVGLPMAKFTRLSLLCTHRIGCTTQAETIADSYKINRTYAFAYLNRCLPRWLLLSLPQTEALSDAFSLLAKNLMTTLLVDASNCVGLAYGWRDRTSMRFKPAQLLGNRQPRAAEAEQRAAQAVPQNGRRMKPSVAPNSLAISISSRRLSKLASCRFGNAPINRAPLE